eukprot:jgi/Mesvir1/29413/Mv22999-RA.1
MEPRQQVEFAEEVAFQTVPAQYFSSPQTRPPLHPHSSSYYSPIIPASYLGKGATPHRTLPGLDDIDDTLLAQRLEEIKEVWRETGDDAAEMLKELRMTVVEAIAKAYDKALEEGLRRRQALVESVENAEKRLKDRGAEEHVADSSLPLKQRLQFNISRLHELDSLRMSGYGWVGGLVVLVELRRRVAALKEKLRMPAMAVDEKDVELDKMLGGIWDLLGQGGSQVTRDKNNQVKPVFKRLAMAYAQLCGLEEQYAEDFSKMAWMEGEDMEGLERHTSYMAASELNEMERTLERKRQEAVLSRIGKLSKEGAGADHIGHKVMGKLNELEARLDSRAGSAAKKDGLADDMRSPRSYFIPDAMDFYSDDEEEQKEAAMASGGVLATPLVAGNRRAFGPPSFIPVPYSEIKEQLGKGRHRGDASGGSVGASGGRLNMSGDGSEDRFSLYQMYGDSLSATPVSGTPRLGHSFAFSSDEDEDEGDSRGGKGGRGAGAGAGGLGRRKKKGMGRREGEESSEGEEGGQDKPKKPKDGPGSRFGPKHVRTRAEAPVPFDKKAFLETLGISGIVTGTSSAGSESNMDSPKNVPLSPLMRGGELSRMAREAAASNENSVRSGKPGPPPPPPPPPPPRGAPGVVKGPKSSLQRSHNMGVLYRLLMGRVHGKPEVNRGKGGVRIKGGSNAQASMAGALSEITKKSEYFQQIERDVVEKKEVILEMKEAIEEFQTSDMAILVKFRKQLDKRLEELTDEGQVLSHFEGFPSKKLDILRMGAATHEKLVSLCEEMDTWTVQGQVEEQLDRIGPFFDKARTITEQLERKRDVDSAAYQAFGVNFDFGTINRVKLASVSLSSRVLLLALEESHYVRSNLPLTGLTSQDLMVARNKVLLLWRAFEFAFKVYNFAGGHDETAEKLAVALAAEIQAFPDAVWAH